VKIEHIALWTRDLESMREFYIRWFGAQSSDKYISERRPFESYFLQFADGARLELMRLPGLTDRAAGEVVGWAHIAMSVGSRERVDMLTRELREAGVTVIGEPRQTGDGYYESLILDPDGNQIEITV
jgi:lactoylglutathione lyase